MTNNTVLKILPSFPEIDFLKENSFSIPLLTTSERVNKDKITQIQTHFKVNGMFKLKLREAQIH